VVASTLTPIPRGSQASPYETIDPFYAEHYNESNGVSSDRKYLEIQQLEAPPIVSTITEKHIYPETLGFTKFTDDTSSEPTKVYQGKAVTDASGVTSWVIQAKVEPQPLESAVSAALDLLDNLEAEVRSNGWPWPDSDHRVPIDAATAAQLSSLGATLKEVAGSGELVTEVTVPVPFLEATDYEPTIPEVLEHSRGYFNTNFLIAAETGRLRSRIQRATSAEQCKEILDNANYPQL